jgi:hypothetical protein
MMELKKVLFRLMGKEFHKVSLITLFLSGLFVVSIFAASREGAKETVGSKPSLLGGGPDAYGYVWEDSDDDTITFSWVPVDTSTWTEIVGLSDDDVQGPFTMGFDFPYYWYTVNQFWVGSNGYIAFQPGMLAQAFDSIPSPGNPNDVLGVLISDVLFGPTSTARAYYYSNGVDSLVVSFLDCPSWDPVNPNGVGSHTFQVVLNRADSTIHYNYGPQTGAFSNNDVEIGIENVTGTVGLNYLSDMLPGSRLYHDSLSIKFTPPDSTTLVVDDVGILHAMNDKNGGIFLLNAQSTAMWTKVKNFGNVTVGAFDVICVVRDPSNVIVFADTFNNPGMSSGQVDSVVFSPNWIPVGNGQHRAMFSTTLGGDLNPNNNSITVETRVVTYPATLTYDDNLAEDGWSWAWTPGSEPGLGVYFQPPSYPVQIQEIDIYVFAVGTSGYIARIFDDDGPGGSPGTLLFEQLVAAPVAGPNTIDVMSDTIIINSGAFYVGWFQFDAGAASVGRDLSTPIARRSLENTGAWTDFRLKDSEDLMMRATVGFPVGVEEGPVEKEIPSRIALHQNLPNPFHGRTMIHFSLPEEGMTSLEIFDITGRHVRTLIEADKEPGNYRVEWNGRNSRGKEVSNGVYFYKLTSGDKSVTQKMVLLK